jgi:hypothetical protein
MKRCPKCQTEYSDEFKFCREDATLLVAISEESDDERVTISSEPSRPSAESSSQSVPFLGNPRLFLWPSVAVLVLLGIVVWNVSRPKKVESLPTSPSVSEGASSPSGNTGTASTTSTSSDDKDHTDIEAMYARSEQGFKDRNVDEYGGYMAQNWMFKNTDGTTEDRTIALNYMERLFKSDTTGKEHTTGLHREIVKVFPVSSGEGIIAHVWVEVTKSTGDVKRYKQTDFWSRESGSLLCRAEVKGDWEEAWRVPTEAPKSAEGDSPMVGEQFAQTRLRVLSDAEIAGMNYRDTRYAINEIYARHGFYFSDKKQAIRDRFKQMSWYRPDSSLTADSAELRFTAIEKENNTRLGYHRDALAARGLGD